MPFRGTEECLPWQQRAGADQLRMRHTGLFRHSDGSVLSHQNDIGGLAHRLCQSFISVELEIGSEKDVESDQPRSIGSQLVEQFCMQSAVPRHSPSLVKMTVSIAVQEYQHNFVSGNA